MSARGAQADRMWNELKACLDAHKDNEFVTTLASMVDTEAFRQLSLDDKDEIYRLCVEYNLSLGETFFDMINRRILRTLLEKF